MHTIIDNGGKIMIKKYTVLIFSLVCLTPIFSQDYYWYGNKRVPLILSNRSSAPTDDADSVNEEFSNNGLETVASNRIVSTSIYTISGQLIQTISGGLHNVTYLPNGMYILQHRMSDGSMRSEKIANNK